MQITEDQWWAYRAIQEGGLTNMINTDRVVWLSKEAGTGLTAEIVGYIRENYVALRQQFEDGE